MLLLDVLVWNSIHKYISDNVLIDQALYGDFGDSHLESSCVKCASCDYEQYKSSSKAFQTTFCYCCC